MPAPPPAIVAPPAVIGTPIARAAIVATSGRAEASPGATAIAETAAPQSGTLKAIIPPTATSATTTTEPPASPSGKLTTKSTTAAAAAPAKRTLVVVDDDQDVQKVLYYLLARRSPCQVVSFTDPLKAMTYLQESVPDVILTDPMMPGMTGMELVKRVRALPQLDRVKILVGSSKSFDKDRIVILKAGANDFVAKPYNFDELLLRLNKLVS